MISFRFPLQKALDFRRQQLDAEESRFKRQAAALSALDRARADLRAASLREEASIRGAASPAGHELAALSAFHLGVQKREREIAALRVECEKQLVARQAALLEARRRCRLMERLRERRLGEWTAARDKELEEMAAESFLAQWPRR